MAGPTARSTTPHSVLRSHFVPRALPALRSVPLGSRCAYFGVYIRLNCAWKRSPVPLRAVFRFRKKRNIIRNVVRSPLEKNPYFIDDGKLLFLQLHTANRFRSQAKHSPESEDVSLAARDLRSRPHGAISSNKGMVNS